MAFIYYDFSHYGYEKGCYITKKENYLTRIPFYLIIDE